MCKWATDGLKQKNRLDGPFRSVHGITAGLNTVRTGAASITVTSGLRTNHLSSASRVPTSSLRAFRGRPRSRIRLVPDAFNEPSRLVRPASQSSGKAPESRCRPRSALQTQTEHAARAKSEIRDPDCGTASSTGPRDPAQMFQIGAGWEGFGGALGLPLVEQRLTSRRKQWRARLAPRAVPPNAGGLFQVRFAMGRPRWSWS
jgi:hypothetical protein